MARRPSYDCHRPQIRALPTEPSRRGEQIAFHLLLGTIFVLLLVVGYLLLHVAPGVSSPITSALGGGQ